MNQMKITARIEQIRKPATAIFPSLRRRNASRVVSNSQVPKVTTNTTASASPSEKGNGCANERSTASM